ncbi:CAP domain-containing protein [Chondrinema litorale]|uniref:CAP domain-containing protein n=1 Tax=Chondrinema litorale TaxID=2994555 RepID=UPI002542A579|nr:CAP domain-containing protein [Chondrinema litorale]UZR92326.1 CAP domain-containing protein [Chondrinema litorale]
MKYLLVFTALLFAFCTKTTAQNWKHSDYSKYDYKSFAKLKKVNEAIDIEKIDYALLNAAVFYESNRQRFNEALPVFKHSVALEKASYEHSIDMVRKNFVNHVSKVKGKKTMNDRLELVGLTNIYAAENIALSYVLDMKENEAYYPPSQNGGYFSLEYKGAPIKPMTYLKAAKAVVKQWMNSPPHRKNLLNGNYKFLGCGIYLDKPKDSDSPPMFKATQLFSSADANYEAHPVSINYQD